MKTKTLLTAILMINTFILNAQIINVPLQYETIQGGIDAASDGDTVLIADGTYDELISFKGKAITVASHYIIDHDTNHIYNTVIDGYSPFREDTMSVVRFTSGEDTTSILIGFTVQRGAGTLHSAFGDSRLGGGILCLNSGAKVLHNRIIDNSLSSSEISAGGGIGSFTDINDYWLIAEDNLIQNNSSVVNGTVGWRSAAGAGIFTNSHARIDNNRIIGNTCTSTSVADGGGVEFESPAPNFPRMIYFRNNIVDNNMADGDEMTWGGGLNNNHCKMIIAGNTFSNNKLICNELNLGAGVNINGWEAWGDDVLIQNNEFIANSCEGTASSYGSAINLNNVDHMVNISNNIFDSNYFTGTNSYGTVAIWFYSDTYNGNDSELIFSENVFKNNMAQYGGAICAYNAFNFKFINNHFVTNTANFGGAIYLKQQANKSNELESQSVDTRSTMANNTFVGNSAESYGGALNSNYTTYPVITFNNIFWNNTADIVGNDISNIGLNYLYISHSLINTDDIFGDWTGTNNIYEDPLLDNDSLHIMFGSSCLDSGTDKVVFEDSTYYSPENDIDGEGRPIGNGFDIGADEYLTVRINFLNDLTNHTINVFPNPFRHNANIEFQLEDAAFCKLDIFNSQGMHIENLFAKFLNEGKHTFKWNGQHLPGGLYFVRLSNKNKSRTVRVIHKE